MQALKYLVFMMPVVGAQRYLRTTTGNFPEEEQRSYVSGWTRPDGIELSDFNKPVERDTESDIDGFFKVTFHDYEDAPISILNRIRGRVNKRIEMWKKKQKETALEGKKEDLPWESDENWTTDAFKAEAKKALEEVEDASWENSEYWLTEEFISEAKEGLKEVDEAQILRDIVHEMKHTGPTSPVELQTVSAAVRGHINAP